MDADTRRMWAPWISGLAATHSYICVEASDPGIRSGDGMAKKKTQIQADEPIGIVISRGAEQVLAPTVLAFVWGPADGEIPELFAA